MPPRIPTPGRKRTKNYPEKYADSRKLRSEKSSNTSSSPSLEFLPGEKPLEFGLNEPSPSPHRTGLGFVSPIFLTGLLLMAFIIWMQGW